MAIATTGVTPGPGGGPTVTKIPTMPAPSAQDLLSQYMGQALKALQTGQPAPALPAGIANTTAGSVISALMGSAAFQTNTAQAQNTNYQTQQALGQQGVALTQQGLQQQAGTSLEQLGLTQQANTLQQALTGFQQVQNPQQQAIEQAQYGTGIKSAQQQQTGELGQFGLQWGTGPNSQYALSQKGIAEQLANLQFQEQQAIPGLGSAGVASGAVSAGGRAALATQKEQYGFETAQERLQREQLQTSLKSAGIGQTAEEQAYQAQMKQAVLGQQAQEKGYALSQKQLATQATSEQIAKQQTAVSQEQVTQNLATQLEQAGLAGVTNTYELASQIIANKAAAGENILGNIDLASILGVSGTPLPKTKKKK